MSAVDRFPFLKWWHHSFLEERPSIMLSVFRMAAALTVGFHVLPSFFCLGDNYLRGAFKTFNTSFFTTGALDLVQRSPDGLVIFFVVVFCVSWLFFLIGLFTQASCILLTLSCYYFYALNMFPIGTLSWDILLVTLVLLCVSPYPGDYFSVDALRKKDAEAYNTARPFFVQGLLQMQIAFSYFYTGLYKVTAAGNWLTSNPIHYLMNYPAEGVIKTFLLKDLLARHPGLCYWLGIVTVLWELSMPFLLYNRRTRLSAIYLGFIFHIALLLTMDVPAIFFFLFPAQLLLFIEPERVTRWVEQKRRFNRLHRHSVLVYDGNCPFCSAAVRILKVADLFDVATPVDYNSVEDVKALSPTLTSEAVRSEIFLVESDGTAYGGFEALRRICLSMPMLYPALILVYFPGMGLAGPVLYRWTSRNRYLLSGVCQGERCASGANDRSSDAL